MKALSYKHGGDAGEWRVENWTVNQSLDACGIIDFLESILTGLSLNQNFPK
jgi:hypothetical protein